MTDLYHLIFYEDPEVHNVLYDVMRHCNKIIMEERYPEMEIQTKLDDNGRKSKVTKADLRTNEYIITELTKLNRMFQKRYDKRVNIVSEENTMESHGVRLDSDATWFIDPLDGTSNFCNFWRPRIHFTCNIGLVVDGKPVLGYVSDPQSGVIYYGSVHTGGWKITADSQVHRLPYRHVNFDQVGLCVLTSSDHLNTITKTFINRHLLLPEIQPMASSLKIALVAASEADIHPGFSLTYEWDTCAADAILRSVGGGCYCYNEDLALNEYGPEQLLRYNKENLRNPEQYIAMPATEGRY